MVYSPEEVADYTKDCIERLAFEFGFSKERAIEVAEKKKEEWIPIFLDLRQSGQLPDLSE